MTNHIGEATRMVRSFIATLIGPVVFAAGLSLLGMAVLALQTSLWLCIVLTLFGAAIIGIHADARVERARAEGFRDAILMLVSKGDITIEIVHSTAAPKPEGRQ